MAPFYYLEFSSIRNFMQNNEFVESYLSVFSKIFISLVCSLGLFCQALYLFSLALKNMAQLPYEKL